MRTRSQAVSPGGFVSLETDRAPRRKKTTTTESSTSASKVQKSTAKQPAKKPVKRTRKAAPKKRPTKQKESTSPDEPQNADEPETQTESVVSVPAEQLEKENIESKPPTSFTSNPQDTQEDTPLHALSTTENPAQGRVLPTPFRSTGTGPHILSTPASASSIDTQVGGSALFAAAVEAVNAPSPVIPHGDSHDTPFSGPSPSVVGQPTTHSSLQLSQVSPVFPQHAPAVSVTPQSPSQALSAPVEATQVSEASSHPQPTPEPAVQAPVNFWTPTTLSPITEAPGTSPALCHSSQLPAPSEAPKVPESPTFSPSTLEATRSGLQRDSPGQRAIFSSFQQTGADFRAAVAARPSLLNRKRALNSTQLPVPQETQTGTSVAEAPSFSSSVLSHSIAPVVSSPEDHLSTHVVLRTPLGSTSVFTQTTPSLFLSQPPEHHFGERPRCQHCLEILLCPNGHTHGASDSVHSFHGKKLTKKVAPKKRAHTEVSDDESTDLATPSKRRNIGPPGSTPYARRSTSLSNRLFNRATPYSEQRRRRVIESQGRIDKTLFRLPQLVAQTEADRQDAAEPPVGPCNEPDWDKARESVGLTDGNREKPAQEPSTQQPSAPETPQRGWNIRGLIHSVPRSFSRFLPALGLSPERSMSTVSQPPASERIDRTVTTTPPSKIPPSDVDKGRKDASPHDLTYSLFPAPIDKRRYLEDSTTKKTQTDSQTDMKRKASITEDQHKSPERSVIAEGVTESDQVSHEEDGGRKRKRSPSPDVIPNPPGCSYGLDLRYFTYSSESEDESAEEPRPSVLPKRASTTKKAATVKKVKSPVRGILRPQRPPPKRVRFDASPEDTPSKRRLRATDTYTGREFVGIPDPFAPRDESSFATPTPPSPTLTSTERIQQRPPGFIPNPNGTFRLDYDAFSSDSDSNGEMSPEKKGPPSTPSKTSDIARGKQPATEASEAECEEYVPLPPHENIFEPGDIQLDSNGPPLGFEFKEPSPELPFIEDIYPRNNNTRVRTPANAIPSVGSSRSAGPETPPSKAPGRPSTTRGAGPTPPPRPTPAHAALPPSTPAAVDNEALARARSLAEKYKPKTPSGLRTASRFSSPLTGSPDEGEHQLIKGLGDDEFARDAQWLYANCPSGDLSQLAWPGAEGYVESLGVDPQAGRLLAQFWEEKEAEEGYGPFCRSLEEFGETLA